MGAENTENPVGLWCEIIGALRRETASLVPAEREWLQPRLQGIAALQERMHGIFLEAGGPEICRACRGCCCDLGKNHLTLANLLPFLLAGEVPPEPDFSRPCPSLGPAGCLYPPGRRPFNCVSFLCEQVENALSSDHLNTFYELERNLRRIYLELDGRYAGSSMRGIFIRAPRLQGRPFLAPA